MTDIFTLTGNDRHIRLQACQSAMGRHANVWVVDSHDLVRQAENDDATHIIAVDPQDDHLILDLADAAHHGVAILISIDVDTHEDAWHRIARAIPRDYPINAAPLPPNNVLLTPREQEQVDTDTHTALVKQRN